jgi:hypothetical protein
VKLKPLSVMDALQHSPVFREQKELFDSMSLMCEDGVDADEMPNGEGEYGLAPSNPVPCNTVFGSISFLGRLRAPDGSRLIYERTGSELSAVSPHSIDKYQITHESGQPLAAVYISPYQKRNSTKPPKGFMLAGAKSEPLAPSVKVVTEADGTQEHYCCGVLHRDEGPSIIEVYSEYDGPERHRVWYRFGVPHRDDGPAEIGGHTTNGSYQWFRWGERHREEGPAVIETIESGEWGRGPVYEWWTKGVRKKVQDADGCIFHFKDENNFTVALPDGRRVIISDDGDRYEDVDGTDLNYVPGILEAYEGFLINNECSHPLYSEPQSTLDRYAADAEENER